jgi:hypothetical protein
LQYIKLKIPYLSSALKNPKMNVKKKSFFKPHDFLRLLLWLSLLSIAPLGLATQIQVTVDRNPVNLNDSFQIIFTATEDPDDDPDFTPLERNFSILHQNHGSTASWVNGQSSKTIQWTLNVMAKTAGNQEIPAIHFGNDVTAAIPLQVLEDNQQSNAPNNEELFLKAEATPASTYIQAQIIYTLRVFTRVEIARAQLSEPELPDAVIEKIGEDSNYNTEINGVAYSVTERKYAIFPQKSGTLMIKPLVLTAEILSNGRTVYNNFFSPPMAKSKRVESPAIKLDIKPAPALSAGQHWLPAEQLELKQSWSGDISQMKVGEPLTRTLTLQAKGVTVGQLPELTVNQNSDAFKAYPDQPVLKENKNGNGLVASREEKIALIPSQAGSYTLPAITIPWFNTQTQKMEAATVPETTFTATAATNATTPVTAENPPPEPVKLAEPALPSKLATTPESGNGFWPWLALMLGLGWLVTGVYFLRKQQTIPSAVDEDAGKAREILFKSTVKYLKVACQENNAEAVKKALLVWGRQQFQATTLGSLATHCEARLRDEILLLNQVLYGKDSGKWEGKRLFQAFTENKARAKLSGKEASPLEPLYKL